MKRSEYLTMIRDGQQLDRASLTILSPADINDAHKAGCLEDLMTGTTEDTTDQEEK